MTRRELIAIAPAAALAQTGAQRFSGITMMPEYIQVEGIDGVLKNLIERAKVNAVATSPYVMEPADEKTGSREPPVDADAGKVRLLDRPLWGKRELFVRTAPAFVPDVRLYQGLKYQPSPANTLTQKHGAIVRDFLREAKRRGLKTYLQVQSAIPPGYRVQFGGPDKDDAPRLPDGSLLKRRVANNGSLASRHIVDYHCALLRDLAQAYPEVDGFRVDWPEYPPYFLDDVFVDFSDHARAAAARHGLNFERMQRDASRFYQYLHGGLDDAALRQRGQYELMMTLADYPGMLDMLRLKALLVEELLKAFRAAIPREKELMPNAFPPPLSLLSGLDFARISPYSSGISTKLYTMHWPMMMRFWGDQLQKANPNISGVLLMEALEHWLQLGGLPGSRNVTDYRYPEPNEDHPVSNAAMASKIEAARRQSKAPVIALAHGYGPPSDFERRLRVAWQSSAGRVWVNRYGYLSDRKLDIIGAVCRQ
ncbi:MAG: hypothetical protein JNL98_10470 [Bryobacterales bacterium]|nr:hypothetical protein [Bryobacterales bacterium]